MRVASADISSFRNLRDVSLDFDPQVNVICGENGQGKTNLLEAIWLFTGAKSFRGAKDAEMIPLGNDKACIEASFFSEGRMQNARISLGKKKEARLNEVSLESTSDLAGHFGAVVFSPAHLTLVKGGPAERRRALDSVIIQLKPRYQQVLTQYHRLLLQRNTLLKDVSFSSQLLSTLDVWDISTAKAAALITKTRKSYLQKLSPIASEIYLGISQNRESLSLCYQASGERDGEISEESMLSALRESRTLDLRTGTTNVGPHRDDFAIDLSNLPARAYGSQGQQRSAVLAIKLAESALMEQLMGEAPVILLDDVMSELDEGRRNYLLHHLENRQIILTCCDPNQIRGAASVFLAENGKIRKENG